MPTDSTIIGVVTTVIPRPRNQDGRTVQRPAPHYCRIAEAARAFGSQVVLFGPGDVDWSRRTVRAYTPEAPGAAFGNWVKKTTRLPDAIYENVFVHLAVQGVCWELRQRAKAHGIPVFNPALPGKWLMAEWLRKTDLKQYLPKTLQLRDAEPAVRRIEAWRIAYVKPAGGYGGMGVTRVEALGNGQYRISIDRSKTTSKKERRLMGRGELLRWLNTRRRVRHLVQEGIDLISVGSRKLDFRVVVQRDRNAAWQLVGIVPKLSAPDGVVTNLVAGGKRLTLSEAAALVKASGHTIRTERLEQCAMDIARYISQRAPLTGIVGFDIGQDKNGRVYMIEMNPKPARSLLDNEMRRRSAVYSAGFATYLAKTRKPARER